MQWKIAPPSRLADRFHRWAVRWGFPFLAWLAPRAPRRFLFVNARWIIAVVMAVNPAAKREIAGNLARILGQPPSSPEVQRAVRQMLRHFAYYWVDLFRFGQLPSGQALALVERACGLEQMAAARAQGRGLILLTAHLGNWELGGVLLGQGEIPVSVVYVPDQFAEAESFRSLFRGLAQVEQIPLRPGDQFASLPVLRALREQRVVALQGDRDPTDSGSWFEFFGAPAPFPTGPFYLARMAGAPLLPAFIAYTEKLGLEIEVGPPIVVPVSADREADVRQALAQWVAVLESAVRRWPTQWYTFYDFWAAGRVHAREASPADSKRASA